LPARGGGGNYVPPPTAAAISLGNALEIIAAAAMCVVGEILG